MGTFSKTKLCLRAWSLLAPSKSRRYEKPPSSGFGEPALASSVVPPMNLAKRTVYMYTSTNVGKDRRSLLSSDIQHSPTVTNTGNFPDATCRGYSTADSAEYLGNVRWFATSGPSENKPHQSDQQSSNGKNNLASSDLQPVQVSEIKAFLSDNEMVFTDGYTCITTTCPRYTRKRMKLAEVDKVFINMTTGFFVCQSCKKSGSWSQYKDNAQSILSFATNRKKMSKECLADASREEESRDSRRAADLWASATPFPQLDDDKFERITIDLKLEGISRKTFNKYGVRALPDKDGLILPVFNMHGAIIGAKLVTIQTFIHCEKERKRIVTRTIPTIEYCGLFGLPLVRTTHREVVLTATEFDAMAVYQETGQTALALPRGDSVLPQNLLPVVEQFQRIVIWLGGDMKAWESAKQFAKKLNPERCHLIRPNNDQPGALQCLQAGKSIPTLLKMSRPVAHKSIITFRSLRQDVFAEVSHAEQVSGVKWKRYPHLNKLLKGHRRGELTVFTGPTGSGKTTFMSDYSLDLALQGVNTLWGSFEINNVRMMKTMLTQFAQMNLTKNIQMFDEWADKFEQLPIYFMTFHGQENTKRVIETMSHAVYVHDIAHVIVDNLQFMMGTESGQAADRYFRQDHIIAMFRRFATHMNCHVTLVIHPRKERESDDLSVSSIFGSAKAGQEADNIIILQDKRLSSIRGKKYIQVAKNRFDGELGVMLLKFDKSSLSFAHRPKEQAKGGGGNQNETEAHDSQGHAKSGVPMSETMEYRQISEDSPQEE